MGGATIEVEAKSKNLITPGDQYFYIIKGKKENIILEIDPRDVISNADGDLDCPLDGVLRKNNYTLNDLNVWDALEIHFIRIHEDVSELLGTISLRTNL